MPSGSIHHHYGMFTRRDGCGNQFEMLLILSLFAWGMINAAALP
jgi:hypothetical protein